MPRLQYQPIVGPLTTAQPLETASGWQRQPPDPVRRRGIITALTVAACVLPPTFAQGHAAAPTDWRPSAPDRVERAKYRLATYSPGQPMFGVEVDVPVMSWTGWFPDLVPGRRPIVARTTFTQPIYLADVTVLAPASSWKGSQPDRVPGKLGLHASRQQAFGFDRFDAPDTVVVTALSWQRAQPDILPRLKRNTESSRYASPAHVPDVTQPVVALSWGPAYPDRIVRVRVAPERFQAFAFDRFDPPGTVAAPDWAWPVYPHAVPGHRPRLSGAIEAPRYVADVTVVAPVRAWSPTYPDRIWRVRVAPELEPSFVFDRFDAPDTVIVPVVGAVLHAPERVSLQAPNRRRGRMAQSIGTRYKDPDDTMNVPINWAPYLLGATISAASCPNPPAGLTVSSSSYTDTTATHRVTGGRKGQCYTLTSRVSTSAGEQLDLEFSVHIL